MLFKKKKFQVALIEGRKAIIVSIFNVLSSVLKDLLKSNYSDTELQEAAANITNRIIHRNESRPDPRNLKNKLAKELIDLSSRQLIKEAASMVLILDHFIGDFKKISNIDRIAEAKKLGGNHTGLIIKKLDPSVSKPKEIFKLSITMSETLNGIAESGFKIS